MANFFAVYCQEKASKSKPKENHAASEYLAEPEECNFCKVEATTVKKAQETIYHYYGNDVSQTPIVVTEAEWKTTGGGNEEYFVVFCQTSKGPAKIAPEPSFDTGKLLEAPNEANFINMKAGSVKECQEAMYHHFPGSVTTTVVAVPSTQWKSS